MENLIPIIIIILITIIIFRPSKRTINENGHHEKMLLNKCFGDKKSVERLINYEIKKNPNLSREAAAEKASESITRDNR